MPIPFYILDEKRNPILSDDLSEWAQWLSFDNKRRVNKTEINGFIVSTVFLCIDHNWSGRGRPVLFETMVFSHDTDEAVPGYTRRYCTWNEAELGHMKITSLLNTALDLASDTVFDYLSRHV